jgi:hypothetical protein
MDIVIAAAGAVLMSAVLVDVVLSVIHPDREGPLATAVQRGTWTATVRTVRDRRRRARRTALAGPAMMVATFLCWIGLFILGYALTVWPFLDSHFTGDPELGPLAFLDALYYSGVTVTVLGFGDLTPVAGFAKLMSFVASGGGFVLLTAIVTQLIEIHTSLNRRDEVALRIHDETGGTGDGVDLLVACLRDAGDAELRQRFDGWAQATRAVQDQLHRYPLVGLLYRSSHAVYHPEPAFAALSEAAGAGHLLVGGDGRAGPGTAPGRLHQAIERLMRDVARQHLGSDVADVLIEPEVTEADVALVERWHRRLSEVFEDLPGPSPDAVPALAELAARRRAFLDALDGLTHWQAARGDADRAASLTTSRSPG